MNLYLVSGTTNGLGAALQRALLASRDNYLVTLSRAPDVGVVAAHHRNHCVDLANAQALSAALGHIETQLAGQTFSRAVLINNAGIIAPIGRFDDLGSAALALNMQVNLLAPMHPTVRCMIRTFHGIKPTIPTSCFIEETGIVIGVWSRCPHEYWG